MAAMGWRPWGPTQLTSRHGEHRWSGPCDCAQRWRLHHNQGPNTAEPWSSPVPGGHGTPGRPALARGLPNRTGHTSQQSRTLPPNPPSLTPPPRPDLHPQQESPLIEALQGASRLGIRFSEDPDSQRGREWRSEEGIQPWLSPQSLPEGFMMMAPPSCWLLHCSVLQFPQCLASTVSFLKGEGMASVLRVVSAFSRTGKQPPRHLVHRGNKVLGSQQIAIQRVRSTIFQIVAGDSLLGQLSESQPPFKKKKETETE